MDEREPTRLFDDETLDVGLRDDLQAARDGGIDYDVAAGLAAFTAGAAVTAAAAKSTSFGWLSWLAGASTAVVIGVGIYAWSGSESTGGAGSGEPVAAAAASDGPVARLS